MCFPDDSRPLLICEHSLDAPARTKDVERLGETIVVNQSGVNGKEPHHQDDVTPVEKGHPYLRDPQRHSHQPKVIYFYQRYGSEGGTHPCLVTGSFLLLLFLRQHHPQGKESHDHPVAKVAEHHREQEGERDDGVWSCQYKKHTVRVSKSAFGRKKRSHRAYSSGERAGDLTWAYLAIVPHPISLHNALKARCELVGSQ